MKITIIKIEEIDIPGVNQMIDGGWYNGRQYYKGKLGEPGVILTNSIKDGASLKEMTEKQKESLEQLLHKSRVFRGK